MSSSKERVFYLLQAWSSRDATQTEENELFDWVSKTSDEGLIESHIKQLVSQYTGNEAVPAVEWESLYEQILRKRDTEVQPKIRKINWIARVSVAASFLLAIGIGSYFLFFNKKASVDNQQSLVNQTNDVKAPAFNRARITLANGNKLYLDSAANGELAVQGNIKLVKLANGRIAYQPESVEATKETQYNTLFNPPGSKVVEMTLEDGSHVWLNAGSSVTYPIAFNGKERKVSVSGEAYFEIMHDASKPFVVSKGETSVQVLGTHFNVNAYDDESAIKVTLLEGAVKVTHGITSHLLKPGQQAQVTNEVRVMNGVDMDQVMAWKNGLFKFKDTNIGEIMRQVARWYDVEIDYKGNFSDLNFGGSVSRLSNVSALLKRLEATEAVRFTVEGRKITVMK